jgi:hypothetical protein
MTSAASRTLAPAAPALAAPQVRTRPFATLPTAPSPGRRALPTRAARGVPLSRSGRFPSRRGARRLRTCGRRAAASAPALLGRTLIHLATATAAALFPTASHLVLGGPSTALGFLARHAAPDIPFLDVLGLPLLFAGVGRFISTRHVCPPGHSRPRTSIRCQCRSVLRLTCVARVAVQKVGGTGTNARSREIDEEGGCDRINSESKGSDGASGLRAGDSGLSRTSRKVPSGLTPTRCAR